MLYLAQMKHNITKTKSFTALKYTSFFLRAFVALTLICLTLSYVYHLSGGVTSKYADQALAYTLLTLPFLVIAVILYFADELVRRRHGQPRSGINTLLLALPFAEWALFFIGEAVFVK